MPIPQITLLQWLVLEIIGGCERPGRHIREVLSSRGHRKSLPAFYQMMARLEDAGLITAQSARVEVSGHAVTERQYKLTGKGMKDLSIARDLFAEMEIAKFSGKKVANG
jgi:DNA-binding PadR family transcriptional regulator